MTVVHLPVPFSMATGYTVSYPAGAAWTWRTSTRISSPSARSLQVPEISTDKLLPLLKPLTLVMATRGGASVSGRCGRGLGRPPWPAGLGVGLGLGLGLGVGVGTGGFTSVPGDSLIVAP